MDSEALSQKQDAHPSLLFRAGFLRHIWREDHEKGPRRSWAEIKWEIPGKQKPETFIKTPIKNLFLLPALIAGLGLTLAGRVTAQTFTALHNFNAPSPYNGTNSDGANPFCGLILSGNTLYGTAAFGGTNGSGTVFAVKTNGAGFTSLYSFTALSNNTNSDGANPYAGLILSGNTLYGAAYRGGTNDSGTVFAVNTDGTGFTNLYTFSVMYDGLNSDGANPYAGLILSGNTLYGTASSGGTNANGTVFTINTNGSNFTPLYSLTAYYEIPFNSSGATPLGGLILSGNTLYGTAFEGGNDGNGTVFAVKTNGAGFTSLYSFTVFERHGYTNSDGANPYAGMILSGNTLYGTANYGGTNGYGTVFSLSLPVPPQLTLTLSEAKVILMWPTNVTGFTLQSTTNLASPVWTAVSPTQVVVNTNSVVTNATSGAQMFYRLSQ